MPAIDCPVADCNWKTQDLSSEFAAILHTSLNVHIQTAHSQPTSQSALTKLKPKPPTIGPGCDPDQWCHFKRQWDMYKKVMRLSNDELSTGLFYCCEEDLKSTLMRDMQSDISAMSETDLLAAIKRLAVKDESVLVKRIKLSKLTQAPGSPIRTFLSLLRGQAALCQYSVKCKIPGCDHIYDYSEEIIKDNLIRGIADPEILSDLLGDSKSDRTLDETVTYIAQKEEGKATRTAVADRTSVISHSSKTKPNRNNPKCWACGEERHGPKNDRNTRSKNCPAWSSTCSKCSVRGHLSTYCSKCQDCDNWGHRDKGSRFCSKNPNSSKEQKRKTDSSYKTEDCSDDDSASFMYDQLCATECLSTKHYNQHSEKPLDHHVYEGKWIARPSKPHPVMTVQLRPLPQDHAELGHPMGKTSGLTSISIPMIADSGCQSSIIPFRSALAMGVSKEDIFPVKLSMKGAISEDLAVEGGIVVEVAVADDSGRHRSTKQLVYVSKKIEKAFLCREALTALGAIPASFPLVPSARHPNSESLASVESGREEMCSCPRRGQDPPPLPTKLPLGLTATDEHVPRLKDWLLEYYASTAFNVCEHQPLPMMEGEPLKLYVDPDARPVAVHKPALVPIHWQDKVQQDLERDVDIGVLEKVSANTPVTWCSRMVVTAKSDGTPRRTVDLQPQNRHSVRQTHHVQSPFHLANKVPQGVKKTVTDAWNGYHSVPIHEDDRHFTTFITPWGRYRYKVAPQGFLASGDAYTQRFDAIISDFQDKVKCVDDTCMWADNIEAAFFQACKWLDLCARNGITLNPAKFQFAQDEVIFAGLTITPTNVKPSTKFLNSIKNFPQPTDISGARAWFGLVNQGSYAFAMAKQMTPFRHLLKPSTRFVWTEELQSAFEESKSVIIEEMRDGVRLFDKSRSTCLMTDWSVDGIGFCLLQKYCACKLKSPSCCKHGWKLCLVGSRFTHPAEKRYAPIEGEALAVAYALHQTRYYVLGCDDLIIATDHKPLLRILDDRSLAAIDNRRLLNLKEKTLSYRFTIMHIPGKKNLAADAASRYPSKEAEETVVHREDLAEDYATVLSSSDFLYSITNIVTWSMIKEATLSDPTLLELSKVIQEGFPEHPKDLSVNLRPYHRIAQSLCVVDGVILAGQRIVVPTCLRKAILESLHAAHQGINSMSARASDSVYWPNISVDITRVREECTHCHRIAKSYPMMPPEDISPPEFPFQKICSDYFSYNNADYVVIVDRYSNWPMVFKSESGAHGLVKRLREVFVTFGVPEELTSDGGPQFTAWKTKQFLESWGVHHRISSVANPHSNSRAEIAVKTVKRMLMDNTGPSGSIDVDKFQKAMLIYRNSIDPETKASPALVLFGRPIRDAIPIVMGRYCPHDTWKETQTYREKALAKRHSREHEKWSEHTHSLLPLRIGDHVYLQNLVGNHPKRWERTGVVIEVRQHHQYVVKVDGSGRVTLRNRGHLRKFTPFMKPSSDDIISQHTLPATTSTSPLQENIDPVVPSTPRSSLPELVTESQLPSDNHQVAAPTPQTLQESSPTAVVTPPATRDAPCRATTEKPSTPAVTKAPRALARLMPHNNPGNLELTQPRRLRNRAKPSPQTDPQ